MSVVTKTFRGIDTMNEWLGRIVSYFSLVLIAIITYEVVARYVFNAPTVWAVETGTYVFAAMWLFAGGYTLKNDYHVRVDIIYNRLSRRGKAIMDSITAPFFFAMLGILVYITAKYAGLSIEDMERSSSQWAPFVFPVKTLIPIGAALLIIQGIVKLVRDLHMAFKAEELK
jgi:TRAP-type mannitol/chloroaromatic compound transport system permease small subunit